MHINSGSEIFESKVCCILSYFAVRPTVSDCDDHRGKHI